MSIFKSEQRDSRTLTMLLRGLIGRRCRSYIDHEQMGQHRCSLRAWHNGKHHDKTTGLKWGYGDNWLTDVLHKPWSK